MICVNIKPTSQRARNRVREHGDRMKFIRQRVFRGEPAIMVESLLPIDGDPKNRKWFGWFRESEIDMRAL